MTLGTRLSFGKEPVVLKNWLTSKSDTICSVVD